MFTARLGLDIGMCIVSLLLIDNKIGKSWKRRGGWVKS